MILTGGAIRTLTFFFCYDGIHSLMFGGYAPTAIGYPPTAIGHPPIATGYPPTAIGYPPTAISYPPTAILLRVFFFITAPPDFSLGYWAAAALGLCCFPTTLFFNKMLPPKSARRRLLDQSQARTPYTPFWGVHLCRIPPGMVPDV